MNKIQYLRTFINHSIIEYTEPDLIAPEGKQYKSLLLNVVIGKEVRFRTYRWLNNIKLDKPISENESHFKLINDEE